jgi:simple sugar transport system permease protein
MARSRATPYKPEDRLAQTTLLRQFVRRPEVGAIVGAVAVWIFFSLINPAIFPTITGASRFLDPAATLGIMAIAVALLMIGGEFDLSAGVMTGSTGLLMGALAIQAGWNIWAAIAASLVFALLIGFVNGLVVVRTRLPSFIVTLATFFVLRGVNVGVTRLVTGEIRVSGIDQAEGYDLARAIFDTEFVVFGATFRSSLIWWIVIMVIAAFILRRTKFGSWIFAVGGDAQAARSVGVPVDRVKIILFMTTAAAGWLVGMMTALRLRSALASQGVGQEFVYIIAAVIGGCLLTGGYGSVIGASIGALIFGMTRTGIVFAGWDTDWFFSFLGIMLLVAVLLNTFTQRQAQKTSAAEVAPISKSDHEGGET